MAHLFLAGASCCNRRVSGQTNERSAECGVGSRYYASDRLDRGHTPGGCEGAFRSFCFWKRQGVVAGLGNNSVEVIEIFAGTRVQEITGVPGPQGVAFSAETNKLFVASQKGK